MSSPSPTTPTPADARLLGALADLLRPAFGDVTAQTDSDGAVVRIGARHGAYMVTVTGPDRRLGEASASAGVRVDVLAARDGTQETVAVPHGVFSQVPDIGGQTHLDLREMANHITLSIDRFEQAMPSAALWAHR